MAIELDVFKILVVLSYGGLESDVAFLCIRLHRLKNVVFVVAFDEQTCKNSFDLLLRYISPVLAFGTERRYLTKEFCYRLQIEPNLLLASKEEILILILLRSKLIYYSRSIYS